MTPENRNASILLALPGPQGSVLLSLADCGLYQVDRAPLATLYREGIPASFHATEFTGEDPAEAAGTITLSEGKEAAIIIHARTHRQFALPAHWLRNIAAGLERTTELREIIETET
ncbi:MAG: hypothetical protein WC541_07525 [Dehalococcoidia bacterium]